MQVSKLYNLLLRKSNNELFDTNLFKYRQYVKI